MPTRRELLTYAAVAPATLALTACETSAPTPAVSGARREGLSIVLVHGAWHGGWCWYRVSTQLRERGHNVIALDLPGHGPRQLEVSSLQSYARAIGEALEKPARPSVLVGHSMGGMAIAAVAELKPDLVERLIFLTAFVPLDGDKLNVLAADDKQSLIGQHIGQLPDGRFIIAETGLVPTFYADCPAETIELARLSLTPQQGEPFAAAIRLSPEKYGRVKKAYIFCEADLAIGIDKQHRMASRAGITATQTLQTSHSPFFSAPAKLIEAIEALT